MSRHPCFGQVTISISLFSKLSIKYPYPLRFSFVALTKGISKFKVYHFNSKTTRNNKVTLNDGTKTFLKKYGFNPRFFRKYYLKGNNSIIPYKGKLNDPKINLRMIIDLIINKLKFYYNKFKF